MSLIGPKERAIELAKRFRLERKARGLSRNELAAKAGINPRTYSYFEQTGQISLDRLIRVLVAFGRADDLQLLLVAKPADGGYATLDEMEREVSKVR